MAATLRCRVGWHRWEERSRAPLGMPGSEQLLCRDCGLTGIRRKALRCYLGVHSWVLVMNEGERYEACRHCGKTSKEGPAAPFTYRG